MRIDKKLSSGILITNPKKAELFFDINNILRYNIQTFMGVIYYEKLCKQKGYT